MSDSLSDVIDEAGSALELVRSNYLYPEDLLDLGGDIPSEFSNWREEQRAWTDGATLMDQSQHMVDLILEGPEAVELLADLGINDFDGFAPGKAKQFVACNPDGYVIGDAILFYLDEGELDLVGTPPAANWVEYHVETGDYDVTAEREENALRRDGPPQRFRYQVQGPNALDIMREAIDGPLPDVAFFNFDTVTIAGHDVEALRHGMLSEAGLELFGPWEYREDVREAIVDAGEGYGLVPCGMKAYFTNNVNGWVPAPLPAVYSESTAEYREWLGDRGWEAGFSVGGSLRADDVSDYYLNPIEIGYGSFVDFDHDFVGKEAVREMTARDQRTKVSLIWDRDDVVDATAGLFEDPTTKSMDFPRPQYALSMYDRVEVDGETVGISKWPCYRDHVQEMMSLGIVDSDLAEPGTAVTVVWGEADSPKANVEPHEEIEIDAVVESIPYHDEDKRKSTDYGGA
ncbi:glycine cleavage system aminomethyltransferase T [Halarchaeum rubridurum]|uniref:Glycine cleavage system aminomethyltransferase T n=1 Tax=Halarchaeum rubridurum TaxID=489911 RepID=A0A830FZ15_9EURY|nr:aminomethyl transferase family protein [Halarchaeum rubridurum]MBP1953654.1 glycine cleavage system aminomethyltransferase T [Halarchaeum rubridurum]GGM63669.1 glycine cleavage system protein T [Halarchaeum rubridurum]